MDGHTLLTLEFERIRDLLARRAASDPGRARARALAPLSDAAQAGEALATLGEAVELHLQEPSWPDLAFPDLEPVLAAVRATGAVLEAPQLLEVASVLRVASRVSGFFRTSEQRNRRPRMAERVGSLLDEREFPRRLERTFDPAGDVRDDASPGLAAARRHLRTRRQEVSARLENLSRAARAPGEESFVTLRGGRYVLSLPASERRRLPGIVHDRSATGKTLFLEPLDAVEMNNHLAELEAEERAEVHRILRELTAWVRAAAPDLETTQAALAELDELNGRARLALDLRAVRPAIDETARCLRIVQGRHPLLALGGRPVVPLQLTLEGDGRAVVVSGPNMGGKTVVLKTVGLLTLMAMAGLYVPAADGTVLPWVDRIFVDIGDEQSLDFDLSTYAGHLRNMRAILAEAGPASLVLIDELGAGTDPDEGAALGIALLGEIGRRGSLCVTTTHLGAFKAFAAEARGFVNAAMEHDPDTLAPTYALRVGLPGRSHAFELARREGWPAETLEQARGLVSGDRLRTESLLRQVEEQLEGARAEREQALLERERLASERAEAARLARDYEEKIHALRVEKTLEEDRRLRELQGLLREVKTRLSDLERVRTPEAAAEVRRWVHERERTAAAMRTTQERPARRERQADRARLLREQVAAGVTAWSRSLGTEVTVRSIEADRDQVWVEHRGIRVRLALEDLYESHLPAAAGTANDPGAAVTLAAVTETVSGELDLRGMDREEGRRALEAWLDRATLSGVTRIRVIHGKGTGALRQEVRAVLGRHPLVQELRDGEAGEGGWGVTIAFLQGHQRQGAGEQRR